MPKLKFIIFFLLITGLPWAGLWGDLLNRSAAALNIGYPAAYRTHRTPSNNVTMKDAVAGIPWTLQTAPMPTSQPLDSGLHSGHAGHRSGPSSATTSLPSIDVDTAVAILAQQGLTTGYRLSLPQGADGVYTAYTYPNRPQGQRTLHIDRYSGRLLAEVDYADYGWLAKAVELGVALHMGNYFGVANQIVMLLACIGVVMLVVTGLNMWWHRHSNLKEN